jgi:hypothetical protein
MAYMVTVEGETIIRDEWGIEEVLSQCEWLTLEQAVDVLYAIVAGYDPNHGISFATISDTATCLGFHEPEQEET